jgi:hypothetical protein
VYNWIWRHLPGPRWARGLVAAGLVAGVVVVLFGWLFPTVAPLLPFNDGTVGE